MLFDLKIKLTLINLIKSFKLFKPNYINFILNKQGLAQHKKIFITYSYLIYFFIKDLEHLTHKSNLHSLQ